MSGWLAPVSAMDGEMVSPDMAHAKPGVSTLTGLRGPWAPHQHCVIVEGFQMATLKQPPG